MAGRRLTLQHYHETLTREQKCYFKKLVYFCVHVAARSARPSQIGKVCQQQNHEWKNGQVNIASSNLPQDLEQQIQDFREWDDAERAQSPSVEQPLYHYTDMSGFVGMFNSGEMWLTSIFHMNDPSELAHGIGIALERLDWHLAQNARSNPLSLAPIVLESFCRRMRDVLMRDVPDAFGFFVGSFSRTRNDLSQWRSYADDGRGVSIAVAPTWFKPDGTEEAAVHERYVVADVVYDVGVARRRQHEAIDRAVGIVRTAVPRLLEDQPLQSLFLSETRLALSVPILWNSLTIKHPAYAHEAETRLILLNDISKLAHVIQTRTRNSQIVSFVPIGFPIGRNAMIQEIMVGPAAIGEAESGVENLLRAKNLLGHVTVTTSDIPYRPR